MSYQSLSHMFLPSVSVSDAEPGVFAYESKEVSIAPRQQYLHEKSRWQWTESENPNLTETLISSDGGYTERSGKKGPVNADRYYAAVDTLAANPVVALLAASAAAETRLLSSTNGLYRISFYQTVYGQTVNTTLDVDQGTFLLRAIEVEHDYSQDIYSAMWGPITKVFKFSSWYLDASRLKLPTKWTVSTNGFTEGQVSLLGLKVNSDAPNPEELPAEYRTPFNEVFRVTPEEFAKRNLGNGDHAEIAPGLLMVPGKERAYNTLLIKQDKGLVVVEAPYSNANSRQVLEFAGDNFPGVAVSAVISTDQFWFHIAGLPEYAKNQVPIYVLDANVELVQRLLASEARSGNTKLPTSPIHIVRNRTSVGSGPNRIIVLPFRGAASQRMLAVYLPEIKFLYCSDLYLPQAWGHQYWIEHLAEIRDLIQREHLDVEKIAGESETIRDWAELSALIPR
jgi:hypothetical protein